MMACRTVKNLRFLRPYAHLQRSPLISCRIQPVLWPASRRRLKLRRRRLEIQRSFSASSTPPDPNHDDKDDNNVNAPPTTTTTWVEDYLPLNVQPYAHLARMDKPIGTFLLLWPCWWSTALAAPHGALPDVHLLGLFGVGAFVMRGAGCTINDMWDADFDRHVARTRTRPLASGQLTKGQALGFLAVQLSAGLGVLLSLPHTLYCFQLGFTSLPLVATYPLMKRYTNWPQLVLGLTFNWGAFMGWAATYGSLDWTVVGPLYASGVAWTLVYDTLYAHQDKDDDAKLGLKSTALYFGDKTKPILHGFATCAAVGWVLAVVGAAAHDGVDWYDSIFSSSSSMTPLCSVGLLSAYAHLVWQIQTADLNDDKNLALRFRSNQTVGALVFVSIVANNVMLP